MITLAVWRGDREASNPWECEACETSGVHAHAFDESDPDAEQDSEGRWVVPAYRVAPSARGDIEDAMLHECPMAAMQEVYESLFPLWRLSDGEIHRCLPLLDAPPSGALVDAWDVMRLEFDKFRGVLTRRAEAKVRARHGSR